MGLRVPHLKIGVYRVNIAVDCQRFRFPSDRRSPRGLEDGDAIRTMSTTSERAESTDTPRVSPRPSLNEVVEQPWHQPAVLHELHVERGWAATDIARRFEVDPADVRDALKARSLFQSEQTGPPKQGLARKLWERGTSPDGGDTA